MGWYLAIVVRGSFVDGEFDERRLGDSLFKLVQAPDPESAYQHALEIGRACVDDYTDDDGTAARLGFLGLADLLPIDADSVGDGTEIYSKLIATKPQERVVDRDLLTVFEKDEPPEDPAAEDLEPEDPGRFSDGTPIR